MKKINILIIFIMLIIFSCSTLATEIYEETFSYTDAYANHGWTYDADGCFPPTQWNIPITPSDFGTGAWGHNITSTCGFNFQPNLRRNFPQNITDGVMSFTYDFKLFNDSNILVGSPVLRVSFRNTTQITTNQITFNHHADSLNVTSSGLIGFEKCNVLITDTVLSYPDNYNGSWIIEINLDSLTYTWVVNSQIICDSKPLMDSAGQIQLGAVRIFNSVDNSETMLSQLDNLVIDTQGSTLNIFGVNEPCNSPSECLTGKCQNGICVKKLFRESCSSDFECLSTSCINEMCTKPSAWKLIDAGKDEQFGDDDDTNNFISLMIIFGVSGFILWIGHKSRMIAVSSVALMMGLTFFFTLVGWLSFFISFGILIGGIIVFFILMVLGGKSE